MSEMVERVTGAISAAMDSDGSYPDGSLNVRALAIAAVKSMREPTDAMVDEGNAWLDSDHPADASWRAMIDEILK